MIKSPRFTASDAKAPANGDMHMAEPAAPYSIPETIEPQLMLVRDYWESLKRRENAMPFWDDVNTSALPELSSKLLLIDVFQQPVRFRFRYVGQDIEHRYSAEMLGKFTDEIELHSPLEYLNSQCHATIESRGPTFYRQMTERLEKRPSPGSYSRLLLPMWGDGHIGMLLGAIV
jgi:hypothetical protein